MNDLPPPPRQIRGGFGAGMWVGRIILAPFLVLPVIVTYFLVLVVVWAACYTEVPGRVTAGRVTHGSKGRINYSLNYAYETDGRAYHSDQSVDATTYQKLKPEAGGLEKMVKRVNIRHFGGGMFHYSDIKEAESVAVAVARAGFVFLLVNGLILFFTWLLWISPLRVRWLFIHGVTAPAAVIQKTSQKNKRSTTYYASLAYEHPVTHDRLERKVTVYKKKDWDAVQTGDIVTVLCHSQKSKRIAVAEWGPYQIIR